MTGNFVVRVCACVLILDDWVVELMRVVLSRQRTKMMLRISVVVKSMVI